MKLTSMTDKAFKFAIPILALFSLCFCLIDMSISTKNVVTAIFLLICVTCVGFAVLSLFGRLSEKQIILSLFVVGFLIRLLYIVYTNSTIRQHDVQTFYHENGHAGYIMYLANNGFRLYDGNPTEVYSFYHPPLWHFIAAVFFKLNTLFGASLDRTAESLQCLSLFFSSCSVVISHRIFEKLGLKGKALIGVTTLVCFHPTFYLFSGSLNNDPLSLLLLLLAVLFTLKWYDKPTFGSILLIAVSLGLAMMTKLSAVLAAPAIALVFLVKLIQSRKDKPLQLIGQYAAFGAVCAPLGLWWEIRNLLRFGVPITYVPLVTEKVQYVGDVPVLKRLFGLQYAFPFISLPYYNNFAEQGEPLEYNVFMSLLKTSVFGEYTFNLSYLQVVLCYVLFWVNIVIAFFAVYAIVAALIKVFKKQDARDKLFTSSLALLYLTFMVSQIKFSFDFPHVCTMNFRYIVPTLIVGAAFIGLYFMSLKKNGFAKLLSLAAEIVGTVFCALGVGIYVLLSGREDIFAYLTIITAAVFLLIVFIKPLKLNKEQTE